MSKSRSPSTNPSAKQPRLSLTHVGAARTAGTAAHQHHHIAAAAQHQEALGKALYLQGDYRRATEHYRQAVRLRPEEALYHLGLACSAWVLGDNAVVEAHFRKALSLQPDNPDIHERMASWYVQRGSFEVALNHSALAVAIAPDKASAIVTHADMLHASGQSEQAWDMIRPLVESQTGGPWLARIFGRFADRIGREDQAVATIERELRWPAVARVDRAGLHFAAARLLEGLGRFDAAFEHARQGNASDPEPYDVQAQSRFFAEQIAYHTEARLSALPRATHGSKRPVLIVGMPRSGTSLVEQILASHPSVFGAGELTRLSEVAQEGNTAEWAQGLRFPACWDHLTANRANELAGHYLDRIGALNNTAAYVTDKMPRNFLFLGTAQLLLPDCRVIHCTRDPRDTCLSCYFTHFESGNSFSFDLSNLARYYQDYARLMEHWKKVVKLPILEVRYEDVISDQASQTRRLLEFLDLPWDDRCLAFHQNKRLVASASRDQVRRPIYSTSVGRWKHYEKHIPELLALAGT